MNGMMKRVAAALCLAPFGAGPAAADLITYTESGTVTGTLGNTSFTNAAATFTQTADTTTVTNPSSGLFQVNDLTSSFTIAGAGSGSFSDPSLTFNNGNYAGFAQASTMFVVISSTAPGLGGYNLKTTFGPVTGTFRGNPPVNFNTSLGSLNLTGGGAISFQATLSTVPEPSTVALAGAAAAFFGGAALARRRLTSRA